MEIGFAHFAMAANIAGQVVSGHDFPTANKPQANNIGISGSITLFNASCIRKSTPFRCTAYFDLAIIHMPVVICKVSLDYSQTNLATGRY